MTYATVADVELYAPGTGDSGTYTTDTRPTRAQVEGFLARGYARINTALVAAGYGIPVASTATVYDEIVDLEALFAAARVELTRLSSRYSAEERTRGGVLMQEFKESLTELLGNDLTQVGLLHTSFLYIGGVSESDKEVVEDDTDRVTPRFSRGQFRHAGTTRPGGEADSDDDLTD